MTHRRTRAAAWIAAAGVVLSLAPLDAATAAPKKANSPACKAMKREQAGATAAGFAIEKALASGKFDSAKQQMRKAYDAEFANVTRAVGTLHSAPPKVRAAFKNLRTYVNQVRNDLKKAKTLQQLEAELQTLGRDPQLQADGTTIASWAASVCGTTPPPATGTG